MESLFEVITPWHWLVLALILLGIEIMLGTFDLLWISAAGFLTAGYSALQLPEPMSSWQAEAIAFAVFSVVLLIAGRTIFSGLKKSSETDRPSLNQRGKSMIGKSAVIVDDFVNGEGRVRVGDTTWMAQSVSGDNLSGGMNVRVTDVDGTVLKVGV